MKWIVESVANKNPFFQDHQFQDLRSSTIWCSFLSRSNNLFGKV